MAKNTNAVPEWPEPGVRPRRRRARGTVQLPGDAAVRREIRREKHRRYLRHRRRVLLAVLVTAALLGALIATQLVEIVVVRGAGMSPTLKNGCLAVCLKQEALDALSLMTPAVRRSCEPGDLVLFEYQQKVDGPLHSGEARAMLIKRVIGVGGDVIDCKGSAMSVNGEALTDAAPGSDLVYPITVPAGEMYVMGDYRAVAADSRRRAFGTVPERAVKGRVLAVIWPAFEFKLLIPPRDGA